MSNPKSLIRPHFYEEIDGWFDFDDIYREMVEQAENRARFVEIGAWLGRSTAFMAVEIANSGKSIDFFAIDTWLGSPNESCHQDLVRRHGGSIYPAFLDNMRSGGVEQYVTPLKMTSQEALDRFDDDSLDFVFIDGSHDYPEVRNDISKWKTKVKPGQILAGHDLGWPGVRQAVEEVRDRYNAGTVILIGSSAFTQPLCGVRLCGDVCGRRLDRLVDPLLHEVLRMGGEPIVGQ